jgi:hypothetical protein
VYDSRRNSFLSIDAYKNTLPGLYSLMGMMAIRGRPAKNKILFLDFYTMETHLYDVTSDVVQKQLPPTEWIRKNISWASHLLTINDSTAIIYGGIPGIYTIHIDPKTLQLSYDSIPLFMKQICTAAILDIDNRLWIGTKKGLFRQNIKMTSLHSIKHPLLNKEDITYPIPFSSFLRKKHLLYAGTYARLPIMILDGNTYKLKKQISFSSLSPLCALRRIKEQIIVFTFYAA